MRLKGYTFPIVMCLLTVLVAARYAQISRSGREYNFVVRTDGEGLCRIKSGLAEADLQGVKDSEIEGGLYRITVRCPPDKVGVMWSVMNRLQDRRSEK